MAYINTQQTDTGGSGPYVKIVTDAASGNVVANLIDGFDNFSNYYNTLVEKFGKDGFIKDIEYSGTKYSYLSKRPNLYKSGGWNTYGDRGREGTYYYKLPVGGLSVPNCTAWAFARILEILIATGLCYTKDSEKIAGKTYITSPNDQRITDPTDSGLVQSNVQYSLNCIRSMLDCGDGRQFIDNWPAGAGTSQNPNPTIKNGWRNFGWGVNTITPRPGCIVAWKGISNTSQWWVPNASTDSNNMRTLTNGSTWEYGFPGHVAVVEKVLNAGTEDESIIVSESNYSGGGTAWNYLVKMYEIKKNNSTGRPYGLYNLTCLGFAYNPACDLIQGGKPGSPTITTVKKQIGSEWTEEELAALNDMIQDSKDANGGVLPAEGTVGEQVKITHVLGYQDKEGKRKVNQSYAGRIAQVIKVHEDKYIYNIEVGILENKKPITWGFYRRKDLIKPEETQPVDEEENN